MSTVPTDAPSVQSPLHVECQFSFLHAGSGATTGMVIRENGKLRPSSMDEIEQSYGQAMLNAAIENPGRRINLTPQTPINIARPYRCRCWADYRGNNATIILPALGKVIVPVERAAADRELGTGKLISIFNRVLDADNAARRNAWKNEKAYIDLNGDDVALLAASKLTSIVVRPAKLNPAAWTPPTRPAA